MRYTIIHHDVREHFDLTPIQYMVVDSIHQLSHGAPTKKPGREIARFLGIDEGSFRTAIKVATIKEIIYQSEDGLTSTEKWNHAVTYIPVRKDSAEVRKDSASYNIYIKNNNSETKVPHSVNDLSISSEGYTTVPVNEDGDIAPARKKAETTNDAPTVFKVFQEELKVFTAGWVKNKTERQNAQILFKEKGIDKIRNALRFYYENRKEPFIPDVTSPYRLANKWDALLKFRDKNGL